MPTLFKGITQKSDGNMRIAVDVGSANRHNYFTNLSLSTDSLSLANLVHGNTVTVVREEDRGKVQETCDALVTNVPNTILGVTAADCLPVYFWNKQKTIIGIAHAGWRGIRSTIVQEVVKALVAEYACDVSEICVEIGPHIMDCHFEIKDDLAEMFSEYSDDIRRADGKIYLNLQNIAMKQLLATGVQHENVQLSTVCTHCNDIYFSYRRDKPEIIEAVLAYIVLQN